MSKSVTSRSNLSGVFSRQPYGLTRRTGCQHRVAKRYEHSLVDPQQCRLIIHDDQGLVATLPLPLLAPGARLYGLAGAPRKVDRDGRALPGSALKVDAAGVLLDDSIYGRQAEPGTLAHLLGREEGIEGV